MGLFATARNNPAPASAPVPLSEADVQAITDMAAGAWGPLRTRTTPRGVLIQGAGAFEAVTAPLRSLGYAADQVDAVTVSVTGWHPAPGTATVAEIDARIDALYALRAEAQAANRLGPGAGE